MIGSLRKGCLCGMILAGALIGFGCDDDDNNEPILEIRSPAAGEEVELDDDMRLDVRIATADFDLEPIGGCLDADPDDACGQVILKIDGDACNIPGTNYNAILTESDNTIEADFSLCPAGTQFGQHTITVMLMREGTPVMGTDQAPVQASITLTTMPNN